MRWVCWVFVPLAVYGLTGPAAASEPAFGTDSPCVGCGHSYPYGAPACGVQFFGWRPGCCRCQPSVCDNAWAGYCQEKARWRALCYRVGTGGASCGEATAPSCYFTPAESGAAAEPTPAGPDLPGPTPQPEEDSAAPLPPTLTEPPMPVDPFGPAQPSEPPLPPPIGEPLLPPGMGEPPPPPQPGGVKEPSALPPLPKRAPEETTLNWRSLRPLRTNDPASPAHRRRLR